MIRSLSFIVLTHFFQFNELKILRQPGYLLFFKLNQQYFFTVHIKMISEGSCDTEDWNKDAENYIMNKLHFKIK